MRVCALQRILEIPFMVSNYVKIKEGFLIRNVYARPVSQWNHYDKDIHTPGTWIAWDMADAKLHRTKAGIPVAATSEATDVFGAVETEESRSLEFSLAFFV